MVGGDIERLAVLGKADRVSSFLRSPVADRPPFVARSVTQEQIIAAVGSGGNGGADLEFGVGRPTDDIARILSIEFGGAVLEIDATDIEFLFVFDVETDQDLAWRAGIDVY